jgi:hypothetical protein
MGKSQTQAFVYWVGEIAFSPNGDVPCRHTPKWNIGPKGLFAGGIMVLVDFLRHAKVHLDVVLFDALTLQHGVEVDQGDDGKGQDGTNDAEDVFVLLEKVILHGVDLFNFFKISVFSNVGVDMGLLFIFGLAFRLTLIELLHVLLEFLHLSFEYQLDDQVESIENQDGEKQYFEKGSHV